MPGERDSYGKQLVPSHHMSRHKLTNAPCFFSSTKVFFTRTNNVHTDIVTRCFEDSPALGYLGLLSHFCKSSWRARTVYS